MTKWVSSTYDTLLNCFTCKYHSILYSGIYRAEHEEKQNKFRALRNRQDLFQEEGILNLILEAIDKINIMTSQGFMVSLASDESGQNWDIISGYLYQLLGKLIVLMAKRWKWVHLLLIMKFHAYYLTWYSAAIIKGNHTNCAQFANSNRLNWLFSRLGSQASSEGTGMLDVLHCVLIDSPEALNMMRVLILFDVIQYHSLC